MESRNGQRLNIHNSWRQTQPIPGPVCFEEGRIVDDGWKQGGERPQQKGGKELGDDGILEVTKAREVHKQLCEKYTQ